MADHSVHSQRKKPRSGVGLIELLAANGRTTLLAPIRKDLANSEALLFGTAKGQQQPIGQPDAAQAENAVANKATPINSFLLKLITTSGWR